MLKKSYSETRPVCLVTFTLPNEAARGGRDVRVLGDFNGWSWEQGLRMVAGPAGFSAEVELAADADHEFRYLIDNQFWENDWEADGYRPTPFNVDNSVVSLRAVVARPAPLSEPVGEDDLTRVEGIGPKISELLKAAGVRTFAQLAATPVDTIKGLLTAAGSRFQMHDPSTWAEQARLAASGDWASLKALQDELKGGKR